MVDQHIIFPLISHNYVYCYNMTKLFEPHHLIHTGTRIPDPPFSSFGPSRDYGMDHSLEVYL